MLKTPSGYVQQSPWLSVANKQLELMGRYMTELGMTPASRSRVAAAAQPGSTVQSVQIEFVSPAERDAEQFTRRIDELRRSAETPN